MVGFVGDVYSPPVDRYPPCDFEPSRGGGRGDGETPSDHHGAL